MFHNRRVRIISAAVVGVVGFFASQRAQAATADFLYEPQVASQSVPTAGTTVSLELFLMATTTNGQNVINTYDGLLSAGVAMTVASHTGTTGSTIASFALDTADFAGPSQPPTITPSITSGTNMQGASESTGTGSTTGVTFGNTAGGTVVNPAANHEIYLGTVTLTAGSAGSSTVFNVGENGSYPNTDGGFTLTFNPPFAQGGGYDLDNPSGNTPGGPTYAAVENNVTTFTLNVAGSIPEPGTLGLLAPGQCLPCFDGAGSPDPDSARIQMARMTLQQAFETATACFRSGRPDEAESLCRQILALDRNNDSALHLLGLLAGQSGHLGEAVELIAKAIAINPSIAVYHNNLGESYRRLGQSEQAIAAYRKAIEFSPGNPRPWQYLGKVLGDLGRTGEALAACHEAVSIDPGRAELHDNLCAALAAHGDPVASAAAAATAIRLDPKLPTAHANLGGALVQLGRPAEAAAALRTAIGLNSQLTLAHWNLGLALLTLGDWEAGWAEYEWRWKCDFSGRSRGFSQSLWGGEPLTGRTILLHAEQGIGDTVQFVRYAPLVAARGGGVLLECHPDLSRLVGSAAGITQIIPGGQPLPRFDVHCPLLSVPGIFDTRPQSVPAQVPYLEANPRLVEFWSKRIVEQDGRLGPVRQRVGLVWAGSPTHQNDRNRSITLGHLATFAGTAGTRFYSLQHGPAADQAAHPPPGMDLVDWSADFRDMADTAALVSCLDLVITVDTAAAHLAGALGKPVWTLLPYAPDWRWMLERSDSPWYPTMRLFRQPRRGDWENVLREVAGKLSVTF